MKGKHALCTGLLGLMALVPATVSRAFAYQAFSGTLAATIEEGDPAGSEAPDSNLYADGTRAINEGRWSDAEGIFKNVAGQRGEHADGALYWKAYAENKQGQPGRALATCNELSRDYPKSRWIDECGALEIEIRARSGQPVEPNAADSDDVKLLALNKKMQKNELRALPEIQRILENDPSDKLGDKVLFVLAQGKTQQARDLLAQVAQGKINAAHPNSAMQARANTLLGSSAEPATSHADDGNAARPISLDVVVNDKSGHPIHGLQASDFTLLDNKRPQGVVSVREAGTVSTATAPPVELILAIDAINTDYRVISDELQWLHQYLAKGGAQVALPTSFAILTDEELIFQDHPTRDAGALGRYLDSNRIGLRTFRRSSGYWGSVEREQRSLQALDYLVAQAGKLPGRKLVVWISPGWDTGWDPTNWTPTRQDQERVFARIVATSASLRDAHITLDSIDPTISPGHVLQPYYNYLMKGATDPRKADYGSLLLQVLATQSGGQVLAGSSDLPDLIDQCTTDAGSYYVLTFNPPSATRPNEYQGIEVKADKPGVTARTRTGYYAQP